MGGISIFRRAWLALSLVVLVACASPSSPYVLPASSFCGFPGGDNSGPAPAGSVELEVWVRPYQQYCGRILATLDAAKLLDQPKVVVRPRVFELGDQPFQNLVQKTFQNHGAPDILLSSYHAQLILWWQAGYIEPLEDCLSKHVEYNAVWPFIQHHALYEGNHVLGVPIGVDQNVLYFNRNLLRSIGWTQTKIDNLPAEIARGQFTLEDMRDVAQYAVDSGRVARGFAIWGDMSKGSEVEWLYSSFIQPVFDTQSRKFILDQNALTSAYRYHHQLFAQGLMSSAFLGNINNDNWMNGNVAFDAFAYGRVLFWVGSTRVLSALDANYPMLNPASGENFSKWVGLATIPTGQRGHAAHSRWNHVSFYAVVARDKSRHHNPAAACALLAKTLTPEINLRYSQISRQADVLTAPSLPELDAHTLALRQLLSTARMTEYNHTSSNRFWSVLQDYLLKTEDGSLAADVAAQEAIRRLRVIMPDELIIK